MAKKDLLQEFLALVDVDAYQDRYSKDIYQDTFFGLPLASIIAGEKRLHQANTRSLAYFSMEYGLATSFYNKLYSSRPVDPHNKIQEHEIFSNFRLADYFFSFKSDTIMDLPIYSGGLGVLAGDTVKTMADYKLPAVAIGMLWHSGYFRQKFWFKYGQAPEVTRWDIASYPGIIPLKNIIKIKLRNEAILLRLWKYYVYSYNHEYAVPLILLDANLPENNEALARLTDQLYRSDNAWIKIMQRVILGMGGAAALRELGYHIDIFHLNEGHAVFAFVEKARGVAPLELENLKKHFTYTCHTPVSAGHDRFSSDELSQVLQKEDFELVSKYGLEENGVINLTLVSLNIASKVNAVAKNHRDVMHIQFPKYKDAITHITNGVHTHTWISPAFKTLLEKHAPTIGDINTNPMALVKVKELRHNQGFRRELWDAHQHNKEELCNFLKHWKLSPDAYTICWARRIAAYKRPSLILQDVSRLIDIAKKVGPLQIILAGKAHPQDNLGFTYIAEILDRVDALSDAYEYLKIIIPENYEMNLAHLLTSSVDTWLNNPLPPFEASGTSGMKAILNGVLQISTIDGWVVEAEDKNIGRLFGYRNPPGTIGDERDLHLNDDAIRLYQAVEEMTRLYYQTNTQGSLNPSSEWIDMMIDCIAAGADFNTYRMLDEYKRISWQIP